MEIKFLSRNCLDTKSLGRAIGKALLPYSVIGLVGELGTGKTTFVKAVGSSLNISEEEITSPTFTILHRYETVSTGHVLCHLDAYRLTGAEELNEIGFQELLNSGDIIIIEWADRIMDSLPEDHILVSFYHEGDDKRQITIKSTGVFHSGILNKTESRVIQNSHE